MCLLPDVPALRVSLAAFSSSSTASAARIRQSVYSGQLAPVTWNFRAADCELDHHADISPSQQTAKARSCSLAMSDLGPLAQQCLLQAPSAILVSQQHLSTKLRSAQAAQACAWAVRGLSTGRPQAVPVGYKFSQLTTCKATAFPNLLKVHGMRLGHRSHLAHLSHLHPSTSEHVEPARPPRCCKSSKSGANSLLEAIPSQHLNDSLEIPDHGFLTACQQRAANSTPQGPPGNWNS